MNITSVRKINKISIIIFEIIFLASFISAQQTELDVSPWFYPHGPESFSTQYGAVGDAFNYNIYFDNNNSESIIDDFIIEIYDPSNNLVLKEEYNGFLIEKHNSSSIWANESLQFKFPGNYKLTICSKNKSLTLVNRFNNYVFTGSGNYHPNCFDKYFQVLWNYEIESKISQDKATQESITLSKETVELNKSLKWYTAALFTLTILIAIFALADILSDEKKIKSFGKITRISISLILIFFSLLGIYLIVVFTTALIKDFSLSFLVVYIIGVLFLIGFMIVPPISMLYEFWKDRINKIIRN